MKTNRRTFLKGSAAAAACGALAPLAAQDGAGDVYPGWKPGEMDLHFIYTGCGENMFYRLPDGTAVLNDVGEAYRPKDLAQTPLLPSADRLGGEWVSRYIRRVYNEKTIDYLLFSHWHDDHIGHAGFGRADTENSCWRHRTTPDGRKIDGFLCVAEDFAFRRYFDHQYPGWGAYKTQGTCLDLVRPWLDAQRANGLSVAPFQVGALNQIALLRAPERYKDVFSIRNVCANGRLWYGAAGVRDFAAETVAATGRDALPQNMLSMGLLIRYGRFTFWTGGDVQPSFLKQGFCTKDGPVDYEAEIGRRIGPVTLCKMNHHGCSDAMGEAFVRAVRAQIYVSCVWSHWHVREATLARLASRDLHPAADPLILPNFLPRNRAAKYTGRDFMRNVPPETRDGVHVVVKVLPGGDAWRVYLLDARDESLRVRRVFTGAA